MLCDHHWRINAHGNHLSCQSLSLDHIADVLYWQWTFRCFFTVFISICWCWFSMKRNDAESVRSRSSSITFWSTLTLFVPSTWHSTQAIQLPRNELHCLPYVLLLQPCVFGVSSATVIVSWCEPTHTGEWSTSSMRQLVSSCRRRFVLKLFKTVTALSDDVQLNSGPLQFELRVCCIKTKAVLTTVNNLTTWCHETKQVATCGNMYCRVSRRLWWTKLITSTERQRLEHPFLLPMPPGSWLWSQNSTEVYQPTVVASSLRQDKRRITGAELKTVLHSFRLFMDETLRFTGKTCRS